MLCYRQSPLLFSCIQVGGHIIHHVILSGSDLITHNFIQQHGINPNTWPRLYKISFFYTRKPTKSRHGVLGMGGFLPGRSLLRPGFAGWISPPNTTRRLWHRVDLGMFFCRLVSFYGLLCAIQLITTSHIVRLLWSFTPSPFFLIPSS